MSAWVLLLKIDLLRQDEDDGSHNYCPMLQTSPRSDVRGTNWPGGFRAFYLLSTYDLLHNSRYAKLSQGVLVESASTETRE